MRKACAVPAVVPAGRNDGGLLTARMHGCQPNGEHDEIGTEMIQRKAIRAVLLTPQGRMLLMQVQDPASDFTVWFAPGGGMEPDELPAECLRREIEEETGFVLGDLGPHIWSRHHTFEWNGEMLSQDEDFYLVPVAEFSPDITANPAESELRAFRQFQWWTPDEISASQDVFAPRLLADLLRSLIEYGAPETPVDVGI